MVSSRRRLAFGLLAGVLLLLDGRAGALEEPAPHVVKEGGAAFAWAAIAEMKRADLPPAQREAAAASVRMLLRQLLGEELRLSGPEERSPILPPIGGARGRDMRRLLVAAYARVAEGDADLETAAELLAEDPAVEVQAAAWTMIARTHTPRADALVQKIIAESHPHGEVLQGALEEAVSRRLITPEQVAHYAQHPRAKIREVARQAARTLKLPEPPPFDLVAALTPAQEELLRQIPAMLAEPIPAEATWVRLTGRLYDETRPSELSGWLLSTEKDRYVLRDYFGRKVVALKGPYPSRDPQPMQAFGGDVAFGRATVERRSWEREARTFARLRADPEPIQRVLQRTTVWEDREYRPAFISLPEALVAAWSFQQGDRASAAAILLPCYDRAPNDRAVPWAVRHLMGRPLERRLRRLFGARDFAGALPLAQLLSSPAFAGYDGQPLARELAEQLVRRQDENEPIALPETAAWAIQKATLDRPAQLRFLASRLRFLNLTQYFDVEDSGSTTTRTGYLVASRERAHLVINPYEELRRLAPGPAELAELMPFLSDEDYLPAINRLAAFIGSRGGLQPPEWPRVRWVVAELVNEFAYRELIDLDAWRKLDPKEREPALAATRAWLRENAAKSAEVYRLETIQTARAWETFRSASRHAIAARTPGIEPEIARRLPDFTPAQRDEMAELCLLTSNASMLPFARAWMTDADAGMRFWGALGLLQNGSGPEKHEAVAALAPVLKEDFANNRYPRAFEILTTAGDEESLALAAAILLKPGPPAASDRMLLRLFLRGRTEALAELMRRFGSVKTAGETAFTRDGKYTTLAFTEADKVAWLVGGWRKTGGYQIEAPEAARKLARAELKEWLQKQFGLVQAGAASAIEDPGSLSPARRVFWDP